jgi:hypothetical protein
MLTIQNKASSLCNYLLVIHCKDGLRNTLVKSILNCIKKILINCADPPLIWDGLSWMFVLTTGIFGFTHEYPDTHEYREYREYS